MQSPQILYPHHFAPVLVERHEESVLVPVRSDRCLTETLHMDNSHVLRWTVHHLLDGSLRK